MSRSRIPPRDPNYAVDGTPPAILGKITLLIDAAMTYAFRGSMAPDTADAAEEDLQIARYDLERTIKTVLSRGAKP